MASGASCQGFKPYLSLATTVALGKLSPLRNESNGCPSPLGPYKDKASWFA